MFHILLVFLQKISILESEKKLEQWKRKYVEKLKKKSILFLIICSYPEMLFARNVNSINNYNQVVAYHYFDTANQRFSELAVAQNFSAIHISGK